jgi:nucleoside-diphosphate-sugar epimerase
MPSAIFLEDMEQIAASTDIPWDNLRGAGVLVTGGTGLIGSAIIRTLSYVNDQYALHMRVIGHGHTPAKAQALTKECGVEFITGDIRTSIPPESIDRNLGQNLDYIIHCAAITGSATMISHPVGVMSVSVGGTTNILELARHRQAKSVVYLSSMEVYGQTNKAQVTEADLGTLDLTNPRSSYPVSKRYCEALCTGYYRQFATPIKIIRPAQTFGAGTPQNDTRVFAQFARSALAGEDIILHTSGSTRGNYCYTADTVRAILMILLLGKDGQTYNVANPEASVTIREMADMVATKLCHSRINVKVEIPAHTPYPPESGYRLNIDRLRELGWKPRYGLQDMYQRLLLDWKDSRD